MRTDYAALEASLSDARLPPQVLHSIRWLEQHYDVAPRGRQPLEWLKVEAEAALRQWIATAALWRAARSLGMRVYASRDGTILVGAKRRKAKEVGPP